MKENWLCPVCRRRHAGHLDLRLAYPHALLRIYRCACGLRYSDYAVAGVPADVYDSSYYDHPRYTEEDGRRAYVAHLAGFFRQATQTVRLTSGRLLDVGCATGDFVAWAIQEGWHAEGIDIATAAVQQGRKRGLPLSVRGVESLAEYPETYDLITLWDVLEHVPDTIGVLAAIRRAMKPNGLLLLKTVSCTSLVDRLARALYRMSFGSVQGPLKRMYVPGHLYYYTRAGLHRHLAQEGWDTVVDARADTPAAALFRPGPLRWTVRGIMSLQSLTGQCYELLAACRKSPVPSSRPIAGRPAAHVRAELPTS